MGGSFEDPSNVETTPSTPTPVLLQSPPFLFAPTLQIQILFAGLDLSSSMLPDSLPPGDPSNFALPVFLIQVSVKKKRKVSLFFLSFSQSQHLLHATPRQRCNVAWLTPSRLPSTATGSLSSWTSRPRELIRRQAASTWRLLSRSRRARYPQRIDIRQPNHRWQFGSPD